METKASLAVFLAHRGQDFAPDWREWAKPHEPARKCPDDPPTPSTVPDPTPPTPAGFRVSGPLVEGPESPHNPRV